MNDNLQDYNRFAIRSNTSNTVQADYIAQVVTFNGNFFIEHNGVLAKTNNIGNGDTILLKQDAQLVFEINSGTQSKIIGPAKLIIQKTNTNDYKLNLIYGNFIQMEWKQAKTQTIELSINDITIKQEDKLKPLNFKFVKTGKNQIVQNNGANIIMTKNNGESKWTTISKQQVVAIQNNDIKIFANIDNFTKAVEEKNISQSFALATEKDTASWDKKEDTMLLSLLNTTATTQWAEETTKEISSVLTDEKQILDPAQDEKINASLYPEFYIPELKEIENAFTEGSEEGFNIAYGKLERRIQTICQWFNITYNKTLGTEKQKVEWLKTAIKNIEDKIANNYNTPPKYIENLISIEKSLTVIINKWFESSATHPAAATGTENIQK